VCNSRNSRDEFAMKIRRVKVAWHVTTNLLFRSDGSQSSKSPCISQQAYLVAGVRYCSSHVFVFSSDYP
jgi:hypothetical protein